MTAPKIAQTAPYRVDVEAGKSYFWCACGQSANPPFCDGSHKETAFEPMKYEAPKDGTLFFRGCKATGKEPLCDGSHNQLCARDDRRCQNRHHNSPERRHRGGA